MHKLLFSACLSLTLQVSFAQFNLELLAHLPYDTATLAGCWHHVDNNGGEYALVGTSKGMSIVSLSNPSQPKQLFAIPGITNNWREIKTWAGYAYVGSEAVESGITIVNLNYLPDSVQWKVWTGDGAYEGQIKSSHTVTTADGYLYINGGSLLSNGVIICDLNDPWNPHIVGQYNGNYSHDSYVRGNILWSSEIYAGQFSAIDITDKTNPVLVGSAKTPGLFNHNTWLSDDGKTLFAADEKPSAPLASFDVSDLSDIRLLDTYLCSQQPDREVHNVRVLGDFLVNPSYGGQLTIVDASNPDNLIETGFASLGTSLVWDADPYLPSGILFATAKNEGLFIYKPAYQKAAYLEGRVTDSSTGESLANASITVLATPQKEFSRVDGIYKTGAAVAGTYVVQVERTGYQAQTIPGVALQNGQTTTLDIPLTPLPTFTSKGLVKDPKITVAPTLFRDCLTLNIPANSIFSEQGTSVLITDLLGKTVVETTTDGLKTEICTESGLSAGQYVVILKNERAQSKPMRIVKG